MRIRIIDAFTDRPFAGNPAAVCLLDEADTWPDETLDAAGRRGDAPLGDRVRPSADRERATPTGPCAGSRPRSRRTCAATRPSPPRTRCTATAARPGTVRFMSRSGVLVAHTADDGTITLDFPAAAAERGARARRPGRGARRHPPGHLRHRRTRRPARRPRRRGGRAQPGARPRRHRAASPGATASAASSPPRAPPARTPATTSSRASSPPPTASPRTRSPAAPTPPWRRTGRAASGAMGSPACRPRPAAAWCARRSTAIASTSPARRSSSSTGR